MSVRLWWKFSPNLMMPVPMIATFPPIPFMTVSLAGRPAAVSSDLAASGWSLPRPLGGEQALNSVGQSGPMSDPARGAMRAMLLRGQAPIAGAPLVAAALPVPEPGPGEVRVRVAACAICRTDLHVIEGDLPPRRMPIVPGHQAVGRVDALG